MAYQWYSGVSSVWAAGRTNVSPLPGWIRVNAGTGELPIRTLKLPIGAYTARSTVFE